MAKLLKGFEQVSAIFRAHVWAVDVLWDIAHFVHIVYLVVSTGHICDLQCCVSSSLTPIFESMFHMYIMVYVFCS